MKYFEQMKEITKDELLEGLLGYGMFAEKIPKFLTSKPFYDYFVSKSKPVFKQDGKEKGTDYIRYESMRNVNIPRLLSIPNPFVYANLCAYLSEQWDLLQSHFYNQTEKQTYKVSRLHIRKIKDSDCLFEMNYKNRDKDGHPEQELIIKSKFLVEADISNCFPSIYSHSIFWAVDSKPAAKTKQYDNNYWLNILDFKLRNTKNQETNGLLIGPHSSNVFSEIILTVVDEKLWDKGYRFVRYIDDYTCYLDSYEKAEMFLLDLASELKEFELTVNAKKTKIIALPQPINENWINQLSLFFVEKNEENEEKPILRKHQLQAFLDTAIELSLKNNDAAVLNYAIKVISKTIIGAKAKIYYEHVIHYILLNYTYLAQIVDENVFVPFDFDKENIKEIADDLFCIGYQKRTYEACSYAIFWALKYNFDLNDNELHNKSISSNDCILMLLAYLYSKKNNNQTEISSHENKAKEIALADLNRYWLYVYEVLAESDLICENLKALKNGKISFIKQL
jgi:hypothetical protein